MSTKSTNTTIEENGVSKEGLQVVFTNGSLQQLKELAPFLKANTPAEVVEKAIGLVQRIKDLNEEETNKSSVK